MPGMTDMRETVRFPGIRKALPGMSPERPAGMP